MIEKFVTRPATTIMMVLLFVLLGAVAYTEINVERSPRMDLPMLLINVSYPGASPQEIESEVISKIEDVVIETSELSTIEARAYEGFGYLFLQFLLSADINIKSMKVKDKVETILKSLPRDVERPIVQKVDFFATSVVDLVLRSDRHDAVQLYEYADQVLKSQFSRIEGVGDISFFGGRQRQIRVALLPDLMRQKFIGVDEVLTQMRERNLTVPAGSLDQGSRSIGVRFEGEFRSLEDIKNLQLSTGEGSQFTLAEIANVYDGAEDATTLARYDGESVLTLGIKKVSDGNEVSVSRGVRASLPSVIEALPEGMSLTLAQDQAGYIVRETTSTLFSIGLGLLMTIAILLFFTGDWRTTLIAGVVIPASLISSLFLVEKSGFTINFIVLLAFATSLGTLIANSIVVIESCMSQLEKGQRRVTAAIEGTKNAVVPVLAACGTNLVVFTPIAFMGGIIGQFMLQFGMTVVYATIFSLIASFTLTPMMCALLLRGEGQGTKKSFLYSVSNAVVGWLVRQYKSVFELAFKAPLLAIILMIGLFAGSFSVIGYIGSEFVPTSDQDQFSVSLTLPQGTQVESTLKSALIVEVLLQELPEIDSVLTLVGQQGEENARVTANLVSAATRQRSDVDIINSLTEQLSLIPDAEVEISRGQGGGGQGGDISLNITGTDYDVMVALSERVVNLMRDSGHFRSLSSSHKAPKLEMKFVPDQDKLARFGINNNTIASVIRAAIYGDDSNMYREGGREYPIMVSLDERFKVSSEALKGIFVLAQSGLVPLGELGDFRMASAVPPIYRRDRQRIIQINGYLARSTAGEVRSELTSELEDVAFPPGHGYEFAGNAEMEEESAREISKAFFLAVILTYMLLAAIMNSFLHPFTISTSIFTCYAGVFLGLFFLESTINIASMLGFVMMVGLAVNNAILILDDVERRLKADSRLSVREGIWLGLQHKFRAVLMTSTAVVSGVLPQVWSSDLPKASMGIVIAGGMLASIFFTLMLTPLVYWYLERMKRWFMRIFRVRKEDELSSAGASE